MHKMPNDFGKMIKENSKVSNAWETVTPLARNEWICWIISAKKSETRTGRIERAKENLLAGKKRPCCWAGCTHR